MIVPIIFPFAILFDKEEACPRATSRISYGIANPRSRPISVKSYGRNGGEVYRWSASKPLFRGYHRIGRKIELSLKNEFAFVLHGVIVKNRTIGGYQVPSRFQTEREGLGLMYDLPGLDNRFTVTQYC